MCKNQYLGRSFQKSTCIKKVSTFYYYFTIFLFCFNYSLKDAKDNSQEEKLISLDEEEEEEEEGICHLNKLEKTNFGNSFKDSFKKCKKLVIDNPIQFCILCLDINSNNFS